mgnify:FL=1
MELTIRKVKEFENPLLFRKEYVFAVIHEGKSTPPRIQIREELSKLLGVSKDLIVIRKLKTEFGMNLTYAEVHVYEDKKKMLEIEPKYILKRDGILGEE